MLRAMSAPDKVALYARITGSVRIVVPEAGLDGTTFRPARLLGSRFQYNSGTGGHTHCPVNPRKIL